MAKNHNFSMPGTAGILILLGLISIATGGGVAWNAVGDMPGNRYSDTGRAERLVAIQTAIDGGGLIAAGLLLCGVGAMVSHTAHTAFQARRTAEAVEDLLAHVKGANEAERERMESRR